MKSKADMQTMKVKEKPNTRKLAFRKEAMDALLALEKEDDLTYEKAFEIAKLDCKLCTLHDVVNNPKSQNCRDNPYCIKRLGIERFEKLIKTEMLKTEKVKEEQKRRDLNDQPAGLINSGNFCYVNSFLQVWFNVLEFRQLVYDFRPSDNYISPEYPKMDIQKVMMALQDLFYTLETTPFDDTDKNKLLTTALRLNQEQQDAQEFTLMLFDALDRNLQLHPNGAEIRWRISQLYTGTMRYTTFCDCGMNSNREDPVTSVQLNIGGHNTLLDAIDAYFSEEKLDDFRCSQCGKTGHVVRRCEYDRLPPVIIIQLNRYTYDQKGRRKLKTPIAYPREIPAAAFKRSGDVPTDETYDLFAVMIHEGDNTDYGHYYDLVRTPLNGKWYKYNDEKVEAMSKPPGTEKPTTAQKEGEGKKTRMRDKAPADQKACYGLLYRKRDEVLPLPHPKHPPSDLTFYSAHELENHFVGQNTETLTRNLKRYDDIRRRYESLSKTFAQLETHEGNFHNSDEIAFLPTSLLVDILQKEYQRAAETTNVKKSSQHCATTGVSEQILDAPAAVEPVMDIVAIAMSSSELPTVENSARVTTRSRNGVFKSRPNYEVADGKKFVKRESLEDSLIRQRMSFRRANSVPVTREPPIVTQVAARLDTHSMPVCSHGKVLIDCILFGDVKAVARQPALKLLRQYDIKTNFVRENGNCESAPINEFDPFIFTGEKLCVECVLELRREADFNNMLEEDDRHVKKILKESKTRCSINGVKPKPDGYFYVAKISLKTFKKSAISERQHRIQVQDASAGELVFESSVKERDSDESKKKPTIKRKRSASTSDASEQEQVMYDKSNLKPKKANGLSPIPEVTKKETIPEIRFMGVDDLPKNILDGEDEDDSMEVDTFADEDRDSGLEVNGTAIVGKELETNGHSNHNEDAGLPEDGNEDDARPRSTSNGSCELAASAVEFNSELRCIHGGINVDQFRFAVSPEEWAQLGQYFHESLAVLCTQPTCDECLRLDTEAIEGTNSMRQTICELRKRLADTLKEVDKRKTKDGSACNLEYGVCSVFLSRLRALNVKSSTTLPPICQTCVICPHGRPGRGIVDSSTDSNVASIVPLTREEWTTIVTEWRAIQTAQGEDSEQKLAEIRIGKGVTVEGLCDECYQRFLSSLEEAKYVFESDDIYVRLTNGTSEEDAVFAANVVKSTRRVTKKNLVSYKMSSTSTLMDLKLKLYELTGQTPMDQLLYRNVGGEYFDNEKNNKTLFDLRIMPKNTQDPLILISQSGNSTSQAVAEEVAEPRAPERGFIDTALAH